MKKIIVILAEGFEEVEAVTPIDFLRRCGAIVVIAGVNTLLVEGSHGIKISCDKLMKEIGENYDGIIIPGGMPGALNVSKDEISMTIIKKALEQKKMVAAICAAPSVVLAQKGLIDGRTFTCYPGFEKGISRAFFLEERIVLDGNLITSRGPGTAAEFSEAIIEYLYGIEKRIEVHQSTIQA